MKNLLGNLAQTQEAGEWLDCVEAKICDSALSHEVWVEHYRECCPCPSAEHVGNAVYQLECIREYEAPLDAIEALREMLSPEHNCSEGWVCEQHIDQPWPHKLSAGTDCPAPGQPCKFPGCEEINGCAKS